MTQDIALQVADMVAAERGIEALPAMGAIRLHGRPIKRRDAARK